MLRSSWNFRAITRSSLGISRATAYRRFGNADQLAGEVILQMAEATHRRSAREAKRRGAARIVDHLTRGMRYIATNKAYAPSSSAIRRRRSGSSPRRPDA